MNKQIIISIFFCLAITVALAYRLGDYPAVADEEPTQNIFQLHRVRRQFNMQGGGSRGQGFDVDANARFPIWQSDNQRNSIHGTAGYSQHLGGPYGNSNPDYRGGVIFTHRF